MLFHPRMINWVVSLLIIFSLNPLLEFMDAFVMVDLGFSGNPYTWSNHRQGLDLIKERLDRSIATSQWIHFFPSYSVTHLPALCSNHNPLLLDTSSPSPSLPRPFRFEEFWTRDLILFWDPPLIVWQKN